MCVFVLVVLFQYIYIYYYIIHYTLILFFSLTPTFKIAHLLNDFVYKLCTKNIYMCVHYLSSTQRFWYSKLSRVSSSSLGTFKKLKNVVSVSCVVFSPPSLFTSLVLSFPSRVRKKKFKAAREPTYFCACASMFII